MKLYPFFTALILLAGCRGSHQIEVTLAPDGTTTFNGQSYTPKEFATQMQRQWQRVARQYDPKNPTRPTILVHLGDAATYSNYFRSVFVPALTAGPWQFHLCTTGGTSHVKYPYPEPGFEGTWEAILDTSTRPASVPSGKGLTVALDGDVVKVDGRVASLASAIADLHALRGTPRTNVLISCRRDAPCTRLLQLLSICESNQYNTLVTNRGDM